MVDCTSLENWQRETVREFESHRLRQATQQKSPRSECFRGLFRFGAPGLNALLQRCDALFQRRVCHEQTLEAAAVAAADAECGHPLG